MWFIQRQEHLDFGASKGIRTPDPRLRRAMLYPAELLTHVGQYARFYRLPKCRQTSLMGNCPLLRKGKQSFPFLPFPLNRIRFYASMMLGAGEGNRTLVTSLEG